MADTITNDTDTDQEDISSGLMAFSHGPATVKALVARAETVESQFRDFSKRLARAEIELETRASRKIGEIERLSTSLSPTERQRAIGQETAGLRREVDRETDANRWEVLRQMAQAEEEILPAETQFSTPATLLAREGLGSLERSRYLEQLAHSGPLEVRNFAAHAVATKDKTLGAAVMSRLDAMSKNDRDATGVSRQELATALVGDDYKNAQAALARIKNRVREAINANRIFTTGNRRLKAQNKIAMGLRRRSEEWADDGGDHA